MMYKDIYNMHIFPKYIGYKHMFEFKYTKLLYTVHTLCNFSLDAINQD